LNVLKQILAVNNFLAYEFRTDLTYFKIFKQGWSGNDFVNIEPEQGILMEGIEDLNLLRGNGLYKKQERVKNGKSRIYRR